MSHLDKDMNKATNPQEKKQWVAPQLVEESVKNTESGPTASNKGEQTKYTS